MAERWRLVRLAFWVLALEVLERCGLRDSRLYGWTLVRAAAATEWGSAVFASERKGTDRG